MITYESFVEFCRQQGMHCVIRDGNLPKSKGISLLFRDQDGNRPDVTAELDFLQDGSVQMYVDGFSPDITDIPKNEILARLNVVNALTPHVNMLCVDSRIVQLIHVVTDTMSEKDMLDLINYSVQISLYISSMAVMPMDEGAMFASLEEQVYDEPDLDGEDE